MFALWHIKSSNFARLIILLLLQSFLNGEIISSVFLKDLYKIQSIEISYKDFYNNTVKKNIDINHIFIEDKIIFSANKQKTFLEKIKLDNDISIKSLKIKYLNKDKNSFTKLVHLDISKNILADTMYLYESSDYIYENANGYNKKNTKNKQYRKSTLSFIYFDGISVAYLYKKNYIDILIKGCGTKDKICSKFKHTKWDNKAIFKHSVKTSSMKKLNLSEHIIRVEVRYDRHRSFPAWLVVELSQNIDRIKDIYFDGDNFHLIKDYIFDNHKKQPAYRIYFKNKNTL